MPIQRVCCNKDCMIFVFSSPYCSTKCEREDHPSTKISKYEHIHKIKGMTMSDEKEKGLYGKYNVTKKNGDDITFECIILKFDDPLATKAIIQWADDMKAAGYRKVYDDTIDKLEAAFPEGGA